MKALRVLAPGRAEVVDVDEPSAGPGEVVLRVTAAGLCHTDVGIVAGPPPGKVRLPLTLGHEIVGEIAAIGPGVSDRAAGSMVAVYEMVGCGACPACRRGEDNFCRETSPWTPGVARDGGLAEYVAVPARNLVALDGLDPVEAAPLTDAGLAAFHAVRRGLPFLGAEATAVIVGIGGLGHMAVQLLRAVSGARVVAVDVSEDRLRLAAELGADDGLLAGPGAAERLVEAGGGRRVDVVYDFVGSQETLDLAATVTARGGAIVVAGNGGGRLCLEAVMGGGRAPDREVTMLHTWGGSRGDLEEVLALARDGRIRSRIQTFPLAQAEAALRDLEAGRVIGRAVVVPDDRRS